MELLPSPAPSHTLWNCGVSLGTVVGFPHNSEDERRKTRVLALTNDDYVLLVGAEGEAPPVKITCADEGCMPLCATPTPEGIVLGGDDGTVRFVSAEGESMEVARFPGQFLEHLVYVPKVNLLAVGVGRKVVVMTLSGHTKAEFGPFPSTVAGLTVSPLGPRVAVGHYGGVSLLNLDNLKIPPRLLEWKGAHGALTYSPNGKWLISAMQEQAIHLWRLSDDLSLHMRGYTAKVTQMVWSPDGMQLLTDGGEGVPVWNFADPTKGPAGQQARLLGVSGEEALLVTAVAHHPKGPFVAIGYTDGLVMLTQTETEQSILILSPPPEGQAAAPVVSLAWAADGLLLFIAREDGVLGRVDFRGLV